MTRVRHRARAPVQALARTTSVPMVDIPLLPAQTEATAIDQLEVTVHERLDQLLSSGCIRLGQQIGLAWRHSNPGVFECMYSQP